MKPFYIIMAAALATSACQISNGSNTDEQPPTDTPSAEKPVRNPIVVSSLNVVIGTDLNSVSSSSSGVINGSAPGLGWGSGALPAVAGRNGIYIMENGAGHRIYAGRSASEAVGVGVAVSRDFYVKFAGADYRRLTETTLPVSGTATFQGDYVGVEYNDSDFGTNRGVQGDLEMSADFSDMTISGIISNRSYDHVAAIAGAPAHVIAGSDITLATTDITDTASFAGMAADGHRTGTYEGLVAGETGNEVAGAVVIGNGTETEMGVFMGSSKK